MSEKKRPERVVAIAKQPRPEISHRGRFFNSHNAFWHVKNCHEVKFTSWLLDKMITTRSGKTELPERFVVVSFYSHDTM
jgi:hypothetical protein